VGGVAVLTLLVAGAVFSSPPTEHADRGKAAVVAGDLPSAILTFRRGLAEHSGDRELGDLLEAARDLVPYPPTADAAERLRPDAQPNGDRWVGAWELTTIGVGFASLFALGMVARLTTRPRGAVAVALLGLVGFFAVVGVMEWPRQPAGAIAVVRAEKGAVLRTGNADSYPPRTAFPLPPGAEVTLLRHRGGWAQVQLAGGAAGWLREGELLQE
jgi:hypothetical protein